MSKASDAMTMLPDLHVDDHNSLDIALQAFHAKGFTTQEFVALMGKFNETLVFSLVFLSKCLLNAPWFISSIVDFLEALHTIKQVLCARNKHGFSY